MINQEVDALKAIGVNPVRFLVVPALLGMVLVLPALTVWAGIVGLSAAGLYASMSLDLGFYAFMADVFSVLGPGDILHGLLKAVVFAVLIVLIGVVNGIQVEAARPASAG